MTSPPLPARASGLLGVLLTAIVGVGALFPGSTTALGYWRDILEGRDRLTEVPRTHWLRDDYYDPRPGTPDKVYTTRGGFLPPVDFSPLEFGLPPNTVPATDTAQLLALVVAKHVLAEATRGKYEAGDFTRTDVAQAEARYSGALAQTESARADLVRAQAFLDELIGAPMDVNLATLPSVTVPSSLPDALDVRFRIKQCRPAVLESRQRRARNPARQKHLGRRLQPWLRRHLALVELLEPFPPPGELDRRQRRLGRFGDDLAHRLVDVEEGVEGGPQLDRPVEPDEVAVAQFSDS